MHPHALLGLLTLLALGCTLRGDAPSDSGLADDSGGNGDVNVEALCDAVFELCDDHWGWTDVAACYAGWLGAGEGWACQDPGTYLDCAEPCALAADCEAFGVCETVCWDQHCVAG